MKFDSYTLTARIFPSLLTSIPFFVLHFFYLRPILGQFWDQLLGIQIASDATILLAFLFLLTQLSRFISKEFFEKKFFSNGLKLPTTEFILHLGNHFSKDFTKKIHRKIKSDFKIELPNQRQEAYDNENSRQLAMEAVSQIRAKVGKGNLVGQHNSEYGFMRNLAGGSVLAVIMSIVNLVLFKFFFPNAAPFLLSLILTIMYLLVILFSKKLITVFGNNYAVVLIQEYMSD